MTDQKNFLNQKYFNLCQQLGDSQVKLDQLLDHIESIKKQIKDLDNAFIIMSQYETIKAQSKAKEPIK